MCFNSTKVRLNSEMQSVNLDDNIIIKNHITLNYTKWIAKV